MRAKSAFLRWTIQYRVPTAWLPLLVVLVCVLSSGLLAWQVTNAVLRPRNVGAADETALQSNWLFQSSYGALETHDGEPARWLIAQPKASYTLLNRRMAMPLSALIFAPGQTGAHPTVWELLTVRLYAPEPKSLSLTGNAQTLRFAVRPGTRTYSLLAHASFVPQQTRIVPITDLSFDSYGFDTTHYTTSPHDARQLIVDFRRATFQTIAPLGTYLLLWTIALTPLWVGAVVYVFTRRRSQSILCGLILALPWALAIVSGAAPSLEPVLTVLVVGGVVLVRWCAQRLLLINASAATPIWVIVILAALFEGTHALAVSDWMLGVDFTAMPTVGEFVHYLSQQRAAFPIPLLTLEYLAFRSGIPQLMNVGVLTVAVRIAALSGVLAGLSGLPDGLRTARWLKYLLALVLCAGVAFVYRYDDRNYWMAYDAYLGVALVTVFRAFRTPLVHPRQWLVLGFAIVAADSIRPFMQLVLPAIAAAALVLSWQRGRWRGVIWVLAPLFLSVGWHSYHMLVLGQLSWSNYAGFNVARAWAPQAYTAALVGLPADMNAPEWGVRSATLMRAAIDAVITAPWHSLVQAGTLLTTMASIPVEIARFDGAGQTYVVARTIPWWVWPYRLSVCSILLVQIATTFLLVYKRPPEWVHGLFVRVIWITILTLTALSETGEQARFVAAAVPFIVYQWTDVFFFWQQKALLSDSA